MTMKTMTLILIAAAVALVGAALPAPAQAANPRDEASGVNSRRGDTSPSPAASGIDSYVYQDEQINIDGGKDSVVKVLRVNQKNLVNDFVAAAFPIQRAYPSELLELFRLITGKEGGRAEVILDKAAKKNYLMVVAPKFQIPYIEAAVKALDEDWVKYDLDGSAEIYYKACFRSINGINNVARVRSGDGETTVIDSTANAAFKKGQPHRMRKWRMTAEMADMFPPQVLLDVAVYEVELTNDVKLGLDIAAWKAGPGRNLFRFVLWGFHTSEHAKNATSIYNLITPTRSVIPGKQHITTRGRGSYASANFLLAAEFLDFLVRKGRARVLTAGRLNVQHAQLGTLNLTDEVIHFVVSPDATQTDVDRLSDQRTLSQTGGDVTVGMVFSVIPYISLETTELYYLLSLANVVGATPAGTPIVRSSLVEGTVLVQDGTPVCLGGIRRTEDVNYTAKIPILGSIPVLGWLFGSEQNARRETMLVAVLTPQVVQFSQADKELARPEDVLVREQVTRKARLPMIKSEFGFDQWLLGRN